MITGLLHASLLVADLETSLAFYRDLLGLTVSKHRPDLGYPGAWFVLGQQQLHLMQLPNPDPRDNRPAHGGRDRHVAFAVDSVQMLAARLEQANIPYTRSQSGRAALFTRDPDGNALEFVEIASESL